MTNKNKHVRNKGHDWRHRLEKVKTKSKTLAVLFLSMMMILTNLIPSFIKPTKVSAATTPFTFVFNAKNSNIGEIKDKDTSFKVEGTLENGVLSTTADLKFTFYNIDKLILKGYYPDEHFYLYVPGGYVSSKIITGAGVDDGKNNNMGTITFTIKGSSAILTSLASKAGQLMINVDALDIPITDVGGNPIQFVQSKLLTTYKDTTGKDISLPTTKKDFSWSEIDTSLNAAAAIPGYKVDLTKSQLNFPSYKTLENKSFPAQSTNIDRAQTTVAQNVKAVLNDPAFGRQSMPVGTTLNLVYTKLAGYKINYTLSEKGTTTPLPNHPSESLTTDQLNTWLTTPGKISIAPYALSLRTSNLTLNGETKSLADRFPNTKVEDIQNKIIGFLAENVLTSDAVLDLNYVNTIQIVGKKLVVNPNDPIALTDLVESVTVSGVPMTDYSKVKYMFENDSAAPAVDTTKPGYYVYHLTYTDGTTTSNIGNATVGVRGDATLVSQYVDISNNNAVLQPETKKIVTGTSVATFDVPQPITKDGYVYKPVVSKTTYTLNTDGKIEGPVPFGDTYTDFSKVITDAVGAGVNAPIGATHMIYTMSFGYQREIVITKQDKTVVVGTPVKATDLISSITLGGKAIDVSKAEVKLTGTSTPLTTLDTKTKGTYTFDITYRDGTNTKLVQATLTVKPKVTLIEKYVDQDGNKLQDDKIQSTSEAKTYLSFGPNKKIFDQDPSIAKSSYLYVGDNKKLGEYPSLSQLNPTDWAKIFIAVNGEGKSVGGVQIPSGISINTTAGKPSDEVYTLTYVYERFQIAILRVDGKDKETLKGFSSQPITFASTDKDLERYGFTYKIIGPDGVAYDKMTDVASHKYLFNFYDADAAGDKYPQIFTVKYTPISVPATGIATPQMAVLPLIVGIAGVASFALYFKTKKKRWKH